MAQHRPALMFAPSETYGDGTYACGMMVFPSGQCHRKYGVVVPRGMTLFSSGTAAHTRKM